MTHSQAAIELVREKLAAQGTRWLLADNARLAEGDRLKYELLFGHTGEV